MLKWPLPSNYSFMRFICLLVACVDEVTAVVLRAHCSEMFMSISSFPHVCFWCLRTGNSINNSKLLFFRLAFPCLLQLRARCCIRNIQSMYSVHRHYCASAFAQRPAIHKVSLPLRTDRLVIGKMENVPTPFSDPIITELNLGSK